MFSSKVARSFGRQAGAYEAHAPIQKWAAENLAKEFACYPPLFPWPLLEIGCGTGHLTREILRYCSGSPLNAWDISEGMVAHCRRKMNHPLLHLEVRDGEDLQDGIYWGGIYSSYALQWFSHPENVVKRWMDSLVPGGNLHLAFPSTHSFPEWKAACQAAGSPCTLNPLPDMDRLTDSGSAASEILYAYEESRTLTFASAGDFFRSLKLIGAATALEKKPVSVSQIRGVIRAWDRDAEGKVRVTYCTAFLGLQRV